MREIESKLHLARKLINESVEALANAAMDDSETYEEAIKKIKEFRWKLSGKSSDYLLDEAAEKIRQKSMKAKIKNC